MQPRLVLAMGASAARGLLGKTVSISKARGSPMQLDDGTELWVTAHPSYLLRLDGEARETQFSVGDGGTAISAAAAGLGKARVPLMLAESAIAAGKVVPLGQPVRCRRSYWLVAPLPQWRQKKVKALVAALTGTAG